MVGESVDPDMSSDSDRISKLESRVTELEATVRGLTEELVDSNERIRELERRHGFHGAGDDATQATDDVPPADAIAEAVEGAKRGADDATTDEEQDDIIVA